jgi:hypothetical protein
MTKADFITDSLSKIQHKKWELYVISRIIHLLDDLEIEFVCQQHILLKNGSSAFADLFFPQFNLYVEINEKAHADEQNKKLDAIRQHEILQAIDAKQYKIQTYVEEESVSDIKLSELNLKIDLFIELLREKKQRLRESGQNLFKPWDLERKYDPQTFIDLGYLDSHENPCFRSQRDALRCFGYTKGHYQRGTWRHPSWTSSQVWFPRFVKHGLWRNVLSDDESRITETLLDSSQIAKHKNLNQDSVTKYTFAKTKDRLGNRLYRFVGAFILLNEHSTDDTLVRTYQLVDTRIDLLAITNSDQL